MYLKISLLDAIITIGYNYLQKNSDHGHEIKNNHVSICTSGCNPQLVEPNIMTFCTLEAYAILYFTSL